MQHQSVKLQRQKFIKIEPIIVLKQLQPNKHKKQFKFTFISESTTNKQQERQLWYKLQDLQLQ